MPASVTSRDRGARALVERLTSLRASSIDVGVLGERAAEAYEDGLTVAQVMEWAELGLGQPQRSWLRAWADEHAAEIRERIRTEVVRLARTGTQRQALERIGAWMVGSIRQRIADHIDPPNADSTVDRKGSSTPLIDSGQARSSIASRANVTG